MFGKESGGVINDLQTGINRLFEQVWHSGIRTGPFDGQDWAPLVDLVEKRDRYLLEVELPGVSREDLEVSCTAAQLTIRGHKLQPSNREQQDLTLLSERNYGAFCRVIQLLSEVQPEQMTAKLEQGVLRVMAPKKAATQVNTVQIEVGEEPKQ